MSNSLPEHIAAAVRDRGPQPFLTYYGPDAADRTELSYATFDNWASKAANWLVENDLAEPGGTVSVQGRASWRTAVAAAACWKVGAAVRLQPDGLEIDDEVLAYGDDYDDPDVTAQAPAIAADEGVTTAAQLVAYISDLLPGRSRVLLAGPADVALLRALAGCLVARGSLVWLPGADQERIAATADAEKATHVLDAGRLREL